MAKIRKFISKWWFILFLVILTPVYILVAMNNERIVDYVNNGFFSFWLSGHLLPIGGNPYSSLDWVGGHHIFAATWIPEQIFPYPLPLALLMVPLGLLPISTAYILWNFLAQVMIGGSVLWFSSRFPQINLRLFSFIILIAVILNGNVYLGLMTGTIAALFLLFLMAGLYFLEADRPFLSGLMLASLALKPPLLTITVLIGIVMLFQKKWRVLVGICTGLLGLLGAGLMLDPGWVGKFLGAGQKLFNVRLGNQPSIPSFTRLACSGNIDCALWFYALIALILVSLFILLAWHKKDRLTPVQIFSAAIALGVLLPPYVWSYDYTLSLVAVCFVSFELIRRHENYYFAALFLILLDVISLGSLALFWSHPENPALTIQRDMWSIGVGIYILLATYGIILTEKPVKNPKPSSQSLYEPLSG